MLQHSLFCWLTQVLICQVAVLELCWSFLLPLKTTDTYLLGLRVKLRSEQLSSIVSKRDW